MARPKRKAKYTESVHIKFTKDQLADAWESADQIGIGLADFIRMAVLRYNTDIAQQRVIRHES
jgi:hypothetical protein